MIVGATTYHVEVDFMTVVEAAEVLDITPDAVRKRIQRGEMRAERIGKRLLVIPADEVERWKDFGRQRPGPKPRNP